ncbi:regulatory amdA [Pyrenophora seminiperda CCB06]|uniref:Regulatory amdA n=1 Tax=Pyrenophora seminiperda CCB06 TaxID=1302712 RepID=A0A3M7LZM1_9PLEO|nr:regulatory amdA [Pyrenophora seminiperda CCB06]
MFKLAHTCTYCSRSFKRAEHLTRHLRTHTREKPYSCRCGAAFTRRDLLTRHWRITHHAGNAGVADSTSSSGTATTIDASQQQEPSHVQPVPSGRLSVSDQSVAHAHLVPQQVHSNQLDLHDPTPVFQDSQTHIVAQELQQAPPPYNDEGFEDFRDFVNFIDGVGLSAQWTPEYDFDWMRIGEPQQEPRESRESRRHSREPETAQSPGPEDIGTPFSTWLPSAPADDQPLMLTSLPELCDKRSRNGTYHVSDDHRNFLVSLLEVFPSPISDYEIPSRHTLTRYITAFFGGFHSHFPFIHFPTYKPTCSPLELTLAMCAAGAQYCFERRSSESLFRVSKAIVFERLRQEESHFGPQTLAFIASSNIVSPVATPSTRRSGPWAPLDMAKTLLILVGYATWERKDLLQQAFALRGLLVQTLRDIGLEEEKSDLNGSTSRAALWDQWVQRESSRRTKLVSFAYINVHSVAYNIHPLLWSSELHLRLPCLSPEWQASSAAQWATLQRETREEQMHFQRALSILLQGTTNQELVHPVPSPVGNYILLHALLQRIYVVRELSFPATSPATISDAEMQVISRALRAWTSLWQQTPESMLDPNNESGPIPFTSSALLVVAYVRLSLNIGPYRHLESRDTDVIAKGLTQVPNIERNDNLLPALLYSTHALSIPVRLGIDRVARSQAFFWSVQHAISSFECAIFLGKWLCLVSRRPREETLSRSEHRILHWVRCIIKEAYAVIDFDEEPGTSCDGALVVPSEPRALGLAVLNIWSRFFRGNTQWQFVVNLGLSMEKYIKTLL